MHSMLNTQLAGVFSSQYFNAKSIVCAVAASSYSPWPGPCHFVMPFKVLVVTHAMVLLGFLPRDC